MYIYTPLTTVVDLPIPTLILAAFGIFFLGRLVYSVGRLFLELTVIPGTSVRLLCFKDIATYLRSKRSSRARANLGRLLPVQRVVSALNGLDSLRRRSSTSSSSLDVKVLLTKRPERLASLLWRVTVTR